MLTDEPMPYLFGEDRLADSRWLTLLNADVLPVPRQRELLNAGVGPEQLLNSSDPVFSGLRQCLERPQAARCANGVDANQPVQLLTLADPAYPRWLAQCDDAPPALFVVGDSTVLNRPGIAIVGARRATPLGLELARRFSAALAQSGLVVASGLALGIDAAAHQAALDVEAPGIAVMPTGVDWVYPRRHRELARTLAQRGVVVSEFLPGTSPRKGNFHRRNRTLSGLALGTLVIEAGQPSGSLITATAAAEQGREVFALPWSLGHAGGAGCLQLLSQGAVLVRHPGDVLAQLTPGVSTQWDVPLSGQSLAALSTDARRVLESLADQRLTVEGIVERSGLSSQHCLRVLSTMELAGAVQREQGLWMRTGA